MAERLRLALETLSARAAERARSTSRIVRTNVAEHRAQPTEAAVSVAVPRWVDAALVGIAAVFAISLVFNGFGVVARPEASAVYAGARLAEGARPYLEVPSSSWPGHLALLALLAKVHLGGWSSAQALAFVSFALTAVLTALSARLFGRAGRVAAALAVLLGFEPLFHAVRPIGPMLAMPFAAGSLLALAHRRPALAGGLLAAASLFHPVALVLAVPLLFQVFGEDRAARRRALVSFASCLAVGWLLAIAWGGVRAFSLPWQLAIVRATGPGPLIRALPLVADDGLWFALAALAPFVATGERRPLARVLAIPALLPLPLALAWPAFDRATALVSWPFLALAAALAIDGIAAGYAAWAADGARARAGRLGLVALGIACLAAVAGDRLPSPNDEHPPLSATGEPTNPLGIPMRAAFWGGRVTSRRAPFPKRILWSLAERSSAWDGLVQAVSAQTDARDTLLGDGSLSPLVALATHRKLALDLADDALTRLPAEELATLRTRLEAAPPALLVTTPRGLGTTEALRPWVQQGYRVAGTFGDPVGWVYVHVRRR